jgi:hypothetical protein
MGIVSYTTQVQQLHNTPSHGGGLHTLWPTPYEGVLWSCCTCVVQISFSINNWSKGQLRLLRQHFGVVVEWKCGL